MNQAKNKSPRKMSLGIDEKMKYKTFNQTITPDKPQNYYMQRICHLLCFKLELLPYLQTTVQNGGELRLDVYFKRHPSKIIKSFFIVDDVKGSVKINTNFQIEYPHHFKKKPDILVVGIKYGINKKYHSAGAVEINMEQVVQSQIDTCFTLKTKKKKESAKIWIKVASLPTSVDTTTLRDEQFEEHEDLSNTTSSEEEDVISDDEIEVHGLQNTEQIPNNEPHQKKGLDLLKKGLDFLKATKKDHTETPNPLSPRNIDHQDSSKAKSEKIIKIEEKTEKKEEKKEEVKEIFEPNKYITEDQLDIVFVNIKTRRGKKIQEYCLSSGTFSKTIVPTRNSEEVLTTIKYIAQVKTEQFAESRKSIHFIVIGTDSYLNDVLRACIQEGGDSIWKLFRFSYIPIGKEGTCEIAEYIGSLNSTYKSMFLSPQWFQMFEKTKEDKITQDQGKLFEQNIIKLIKKTSNLIELEISEATVTLLSSKNQEEQLIIPFMNNITVVIEEKEQEKLTEISLEYWQYKKDKESKKEKKTAKYQALSINKIPTKNIPQEFHPSKGNFTLCTQSKTTGLIKKSEIKKEFELITKLISKAEKKVGGLKLMIDGVPFNGVKYLTVNLKWASSLQIPISIFPEEDTQSERPSIDMNF